MDSETIKMPPYASYHSKDFVPGVTQVLYSGPYWDQEEIKMAMEALLTGKWITSGEYVARFQNMFSRMFNVKYSHMVNSGSSANLVMIAALKKHLGWQDGDEIIVSPVGFPTTIAPIVQHGLKPVFVDIEMSTLNFDIKLLEKSINARTKAVFVSPVLGNPPDMDELISIARWYKIELIGDNCDSLGSKWSNKNLNEDYYAWSSSFYPAHHITTGEGGMVSSNDGELIKTVRSIAWWGRDCYCVGQANLLSCGTCGKRFSKWLDESDAVIDHKYVFTNMGYNLKPLDLQGAIGLAQLKKFSEIENKRRSNFLKIAKIFRDNVPSVRVADQLLQADPCWFGVPLICVDSDTKNSLVKYLEDNKIQTRSYFAGNILSHPGYRHLGIASDYPNANTVLDKVFFLGCPPQYSQEIVNYIEEVVRKWR